MTIQYVPPLSNGIVLNLKNSYGIPTSPNINLNFNNGEVSFILNPLVVTSHLTNVTLSYYRVNKLTLDPLALSSSTSTLNLLSNKRVIVDSTPYSQTNSSVLFRYNRVFNIDPLSLSSTLSNVLISKAIIFQINPLALSLTDNNLNLLRSYLLTIGSVGYSSTFSTVSTRYNRRIILDPEGLISTLSSINLIVNRILKVDSTSYSLSRKAINLLLTRRLSIESTSYGLSIELNLLLTRLLKLDPQIHDIVLNSILFHRARTLSIKSASFHSYSLPVSLIMNRIIQIGKMDYLLDEKGIALRKYSRLPIDSSDINVGINGNPLYNRRVSINSSNYSISLTPILFQRIRKIALDSIKLGLNLGDIFNLIYRVNKCSYRHLMMSVPDRSMGIEEGLLLLLQNNSDITIDTLNEVHSLIINTNPSVLSVPDSNINILHSSIENVILNSDQIPIILKEKNGCTK